MAPPNDHATALDWSELHRSIEHGLADIELLLVESAWTEAQLAQLSTSAGVVESATAQLTASRALHSGERLPQFQALLGRINEVLNQMQTACDSVAARLDRENDHDIAVGVYGVHDTPGLRQASATQSQY